MKRYDLDGAIGFWLHLTHNRIRAHTERVLAPWGIAPEQWAILVRLWERDDLSQAELAAITFRDKASVTRLLDGLERAGYIVRGENPHDRRARRIVLTARGRALEAELVPVVRALIERWTRGVPRSDLEAAVSVLKTLYGNLDAME